MEIPENWPVLNLLQSDDENRLWVSTVSDSYEHFDWWVFDQNDTLLAKFQFPGNRLEKKPGDDYNSYIIKNGALYNLVYDRENMGAQTVIKYRIEMTPLSGN